MIVLYAFFCFFGTLKVAFLVIPLNAFAPIDFAVRFVVLIVTVLIALQPLNADLPIFATLLPIVTVFSFLQFWQALSAIEVTL